MKRRLWNKTTQRVKLNSNIFNTPANKLWRNEYDKYLKAIFYVGIDAYGDTAIFR